MQRYDGAIFDCDNHYYEAEDAFTRHQDPSLRGRGVRWAEIDGRKYHVVGGRVSYAVANPTFDPVARPGCLDDYHRGRTHHSDIFDASAWREWQQRVSEGDRLEGRVGCEDGHADEHVDEASRSVASPERLALA